MLAKLDDLVLNLQSNAPRIRDEWSRLFGPFVLDPGLASAWQGPVISFQLAAVADVPPPPGAADYCQPDLAVYLSGTDFLIHLPGRGRLQIDPRAGKVEGVITPAVFDAYGAFEDITAIGLAPLLRRRGRALIHAFSAALDGRALLLVGDNGSGKTTTGLALLAAGWKLIANDSPMLGLRDEQVCAFAYPGQISAHDDALLRIPALRALVTEHALTPRPGWKRSFAAEAYFDSPWLSVAPLQAVCLLELQAGTLQHRLEFLSRALALGRLLPHSADRWDQEMVGFQINLLQRLVQDVPVYALQLGPDVSALPTLLATLLDG